MHRRMMILVLLCLLQLWGTALAVAIAAVEIESIVVTGPLFTTLGLLVVLVAAIAGRMTTVWYGLSVGVLSSLCFC